MQESGCQNIHRKIRNMLENIIEINQYAPIGIPTLNRYEHLKKVIEGLRTCPESVQSDLYISVDYPPSKKYEIGYKKVCEYLKFGIEGFRSVTIVYQKENLGALDNWEFVEKTLQDKGYDFYILLEDDIVPMPAFLSYMNKSFVLFHNDDKVMGIGAYETMIKNIGDYNAVYTHFGSCLGFFTRQRKATLNKCLNYDYLTSILHDKKMCKKIIAYRKDAYWRFVTIALGLNEKLTLRDGSVAPIDYFNDTVLVIEDMLSVFPTKGLVKNIGLDGTGEHATIVDETPGDYYSEKQIDINVLNKEDSYKAEQLVTSCREYDKNMYIRCRVLTTIFLLLGRRTSKKINDFIESIHLWKVKKGR